MSNKARNHHYIPQAYLRAFTDGGSKKSKLNVYDISTGDNFETIPRNVCAIRDFNRITVSGWPSDFVETEMGKFESLVVPAVSRIETSNEFVGDSKTCILNLMALLATRHPVRRESTRQFHAKIAKLTMDTVLHKRETYDQVTSDMKRDGVAINLNVSYEQMKAFMDKGEYKIDVTTEHHLSLEQKMHETALQLLAERNWMLYRAAPDDGHFISSDWPVALSWRHPEKVPPFYRNSPGFGAADTEVIFPLTQNLALVGEFDGEEGYAQAHPKVIAAINTRTMSFSRHQIYSPKRWFPALSNDQIVAGSDLLRKKGK